MLMAFFGRMSLGQDGRCFSYCAVGKYRSHLSIFCLMLFLGSAFSFCQAIHAPDFVALVTTGRKRTLKNELLPSRLTVLTMPLSSTASTISCNGIGEMKPENVSSKPGSFVFPQNIQDLVVASGIMFSKAKK